MEAIVLAGGLGTRLRSAVADLPKAMAPILGRPFLAYLLEYLERQQVMTVHLAVGYMADAIRKYFGDEYGKIKLVYSYENEPLGTGGAIQLAMKNVQNSDVFVVNGDTFFEVNLPKMSAQHQKTNAAMTVALSEMENFDRYGCVEIENSGKIVAFREKTPTEKGLINGGIYALNVDKFRALAFPEKFSFERDFMEKQVRALHFEAYISNGYFVDIGIPEDYQKATQYFKKNDKLNQIDTSWTLFLDRDGVINRHIESGYVLHLEQFEFVEGVLEAVSKLSQIFGKIIVVTNQQCVGKGAISELQLNDIHQYMIREITKAGGRIDAVYHAPDLASAENTLRKPNIGMALQAKKDFPDIDFAKSIMVGDSDSDIEFGKRAGMQTVSISPHFNPLSERTFPNLKAFAELF